MKNNEKLHVEIEDIENNMTKITLDSTDVQCITKFSNKNINKWTQEQYDEIIKEKLGLSRRKIGNEIRRRAQDFIFSVASTCDADDF